MQNNDTRCVFLRSDTCDTCVRVIEINNNIQVKRRGERGERITRNFRRKTLSDDNVPKCNEKKTTNDYVSTIEGETLPSFAIGKVQNREMIKRNMLCVFCYNPKMRDL